MNAILPCQVACGHDNAALAATDQDRFFYQVRIVPLLNTCIEGIAVDMGNEKAVKLGVKNEICATSLRTRGCVVGDVS